jgi:hypothetical protein
MATFGNSCIMFGNYCITSSATPSDTSRYGTSGLPHTTTGTDIFKRQNGNVYVRALQQHIMGSSHLSDRYFNSEIRRRISTKFYIGSIHKSMLGKINSSPSRLKCNLYSKSESIFSIAVSPTQHMHASHLRKNHVFRRTCHGTAVSSEVEVNHVSTIRLGTLGKIRN